MLRAILNKSWRQHPTKHQLYGHLPPITKTIQVRRTRHAGHCWRSRDELISVYSYGHSHMAGQKQDVQLEHTFSSYVRIRDLALKTYRWQRTLGRSGERRSGISVLTARHDEDDDILTAYSHNLYKRFLIAFVFENSLMSFMYIMWLIFANDLLRLYSAVHFLRMWLSGIMAITNIYGDCASP